MFSNADVMKLRTITGVGMMDCKKALTESNGNMDKAVEFLREKGMASAAKRAGKIASQGIVDSYIHMGGKVGVLVEVNCETDFVARSDDFKNFVHDIALQIAAANPTCINVEDLSAESIAKEREILTVQAKNENPNKPAAILAKMIDGRISKFYKDTCLMEQSFVKDADKTIKDLLAEVTGKIGEKLQIRRFVRFEMGEGLAKKEENLAHEIEKQIADANAKSNKK